MRAVDRYQYITRMMWRRYAVPRRTLPLDYRYGLHRAPWGDEVVESKATSFALRTRPEDIRMVMWLELQRKTLYLMHL